MSMRLTIRWSVECDTCHTELVAGSGERTIRQMTDAAKARRAVVEQDGTVTCADCLDAPPAVVHIGIGGQTQGRAGRIHRAIHLDGEGGALAQCRWSTELTSVETIPAGAFKAYPAEALCGRCFG